MGADEKKALADAWLLQSQKGVVESRTVFNRIPKERLDPNRLGDPEVKAQVEKFGFVEVAIDQPRETDAAFDWLAKSGYVSKKVDTIHNISLHYEAFPYIPFVSPNGSVGITISSKMLMQTLTLNSEQFNRFTETAKIFQSEVKGGKHPHITAFEWGENFNYKTGVYETNPNFYDALWLSYSQVSKSLHVQLTEPFVQISDAKETKNWRRIQEVSEDVFLEQPEKVLELVRGLPWKSRFIGIIVVDDKVYYVPQPGKAEQVKAELGGRNLRVPDFLGNRVFSYENYMARIFEDSIADFLRVKYTYDAKSRFVPDYLGGGEVDVFATKGVSPIETTCCECKLRFNDAPLTLEEAESLQRKIKPITENESRRGPSKFHFWLVSNANSVEPGVEGYCKNVGIEVVHATLSHNWTARADWSVQAINFLVQ